MVIDELGLITDWNPAAEELLGYSYAVAVGCEIAELIIPAALRDAHRNGLRRFVETGESRILGRRLELPALRQDGSELTVELSIAKLPGAEVPMFAGFLRALSADEDRDHNSARMQERLSFLAQAGLVLDDSLDYNRTLRGLADLTVPDLAHLTVIDLLGERGGSVEMAVAACRDPERAREVERVRSVSRLPVSSSHPVGTVLRTGRSMLLSSMSLEFLGGIAQTPEHLELMRKMGYHSAVVVPLVARGRTLGALSLLRMEDGIPYGSDDLALAEELARRAALAVDNARLFESTRDLARTLQRSLLPHALPDIPGLRISARYRAAERGHEVGGDFYDAFAIDERRWGITIGDVCGKGAEAAALTALARYTIRAFADRDPGRVLTRLNQAVIREQEVLEGRFLTCLFAVAWFEGQELHLELAVGGHPAPLVMRDAGTTERVSASGPLIGLLGGAQFPTARVVLRPGDTLLLYTDGLTDAHAPERILSESDLLELLSAAHGLHGDRLAEHIERAATLGQAARDDIALLVVEPLGERGEEGAVASAAGTRVEAG